MKNNLIRFSVVTFVASRLTQLMLYYASNGGNTNLWNNWFLETFDHYQLGILLVVLAIFTKRYKFVFFGIGTGLIIDELNSILNLIFPEYVSYTFNSLLDYGFIILGFTTFWLLVRYLVCSKQRNN